jgi:3-oxoacyl-[acyl-carrier-protein] synthase-1
MMENNFLAGSANIQNLDERAINYNILTNTINKNNISNIMSNSFGFGGTNATLIFSII